jgi:hypothetical protein
VEGGRGGADLAERLAPLGIAFSFYCRAESVERELFADLVSAGLCQVHLGLESGSPDVLARLGKGQDRQRIEAALIVLRDLGIRIVPSFIVFEQRQSVSELHESLRWIAAQGLHSGFSPGGLIPIPGTRATAELARQGLVGAVRRWSDSFRPVGFADPGVRWIADAVRRFETSVDHRDGEVTALATAYHHHNDCLDVADGSTPDPRVVRHDRLRGFELAKALAAAAEVDQDRRAAGRDPVLAWLTEWDRVGHPGRS